MSSIERSLRPKSGVTARVWDLADEITTRKGKQAARRDVLERAVSEGIHERTASKQYNDWRKSCESDQSEGFNEEPVAPLHVHLQIGADGRILIPAEMRRAMKIDHNGKLNAELVEGELRLFSPQIALEKIQRYMQTHVEGGSMVDELLAERRAEEARE